MEFVKLKKKIFPMLYKENVVVQETLEKLAVLLWLNLAGLKSLSNILSIPVLEVVILKLITSFSVSRVNSVKKLVILTFHNANIAHAFFFSFSLSLYFSRHIIYSPLLSFNRPPFFFFLDLSYF